MPTIKAGELKAGHHLHARGKIVEVTKVRVLDTDGPFVRAFWDEKEDPGGLYSEIYDYDDEVEIEEVTIENDPAFRPTVVDAETFEWLLSDEDEGEVSEPLKHAAERANELVVREVIEEMERECHICDATGHEAIDHFVDRDDDGTS